MLAGAWNSPRFNCVGVSAPGNALGVQRLHYNGSFQGSSQSKGKSSDRGQTFEGKVRSRVSTRWWKPAWCALTRWRARRPLMLALQKVSLPIPQWKSLGGALVLAPLGVQSPSFPLTAPSYCRSVAPKKESTSMYDWRLVWEENLSPSSLISRGQNCLFSCVSHVRSSSFA